MPSANNRKLKNTTFSKDTADQMSVLEENQAQTTYSTHAEQFKQTIQWLMEDRKISEAELSRLTQLSPATIHRLIYGMTDPRLSTLRAIASFFKIRIEQLIGDYPIPSVTQICNENSDKIFFSTPILIPFIDWDQMPSHINHIGELTMSNWAHWHATTNAMNDSNSAELFATKLHYTAGNLIPAESILILRSISINETLRVGDCVVGNNQRGNTFVGQISGSGLEIAIKDSNSLYTLDCSLYGIVIKCETPFSLISRYTNLI